MASRSRTNGEKKLNISVNKVAFVAKLEASLVDLEEKRKTANKLYLEKLRLYVSYVERCVKANHFVSKYPPSQLSVSDYVVTNALNALKDHMGETITMTSEEYNGILSNIQTFGTQSGQYMNTLVELSYIQ